MRLLLLPLVSLLQAAVAREPQHYTFTSGDHIISMDVHFRAPYAGERLSFRSDRGPRKTICFVGDGEAGNCLNHFVGAVATVTFRVKRACGKLRGKTSIREYVTLTAQSPELPPRLPFDKRQVLTGGEITDLEAFGYDESDIAEGEREAERRKARERLWRLCRQELYLNGEAAPFATINWRYTLDGIEIISVQGQ